MRQMFSLFTFLCSLFSFHFLLVCLFQGADLKCSYSADFGTPRVEWKFKDLQGSQVFVVFDNNPTGKLMPWIVWPTGCLRSCASQCAGINDCWSHRFLHAVLLCAGQTGERCLGVTVLSLVSSENYKNRVQLYKDGLMLKQVTRRDTGEYFCEVSSGSIYGSAVINLTVEVPPSVPICGVPSSVTTGSYVVLTCHDPDGSPPSTYKWFKDEALLPENPNMFQDFKNFSYILNPKEGTLAFPSVTKADTGRYYCMASNGIGPVQSCAAQMMAVRDVNVGAIVGGVLVALLLVLLLGLGLWFAFQKGYLSSEFSRYLHSALSCMHEYVDIC
uniref:Junctional adhesion molecule A n=1 Tax=Paramormyrops kingsleyae TaxID=1676925 RepID=A0A3B3Q7Y7_9TELE